MPVLSGNTIQRRFRGTDEIVRTYKGSELIWEKAGPSPSDFNPLVMFSAGEQGCWFDPSDLTTLFRDTAGTLPANAHGQKVALMLDKSGNGNHLVQTNVARQPLLQMDDGGRWNLRFDGVDDTMITSVYMPFSSSSNLTAISGVEKLSSKRGQLFETNSNNRGAFMMTINGADNSDNYRVETRNDAARNLQTPFGSYPAPHKSVFAMITKNYPETTNDTVVLRVNGVEFSLIGPAAAMNTNYVDYTLHLGSRLGGSFFANMRFYGGIIRGAVTDQTLLDEVETWMSNKIGTTLAA